MIKVTVELQSAKTGETTLLGTAVIANDGFGTSSRGTYGAIFGLKRKRHWRGAYVEGFPRKSKNVWHLLRELLNDALKDES